MRLFPALFSCAVFLCASLPPTGILRAEDARVETQVDRLLSQMTPEEKILQLLSYKPNGVPRLGIPNLEAGEGLHGVVTRGATVFPQAIALGSTWDPALVERVATVIAAEARAVGIAQLFSPMLGLARDPRWGRIEESYGGRPVSRQRDRRRLRQRVAGTRAGTIRPR